MYRRNMEEQFTVRDLRNGDWFWINKIILEHQVLSSSEKIIYACLAYFANSSSQKCYPSIPTLSEFSGLHEDTVRKSIKELEKYKFISVKREYGKNNIYSLLKLTYSNLSKKLPPRKKHTTPKRRGHNPPEIKGSNNNNINNNNIITKVIKRSFGNPELNELLEYSKGIGFPLQGTVKMNRFTASNLLKKFGLDNSKRFVAAAVNCRGKPFSPTINDFIQLYRKVGDLVIYYQKGKNDKQFINLDH